MIPGWFNITGYLSMDFSYGYPGLEILYGYLTNCLSYGYPSLKMPLGCLTKYLPKGFPGYPGYLFENKSKGINYELIWKVSKWNIFDEVSNILKCYKKREKSRG